MRALISIFAIIIAISAAAQIDYTPVNRDSVKMLITDASRECYYPKLLQRFNQFDSTLTLEDYRLLYYGFVFQKEYVGYPDQKQKEINEFINSKKYKEAVKTCDLILKQIPISLTANYLKGLSIYLNNKEDTSFLNYRNRYTLLRNAILSTGNGLTCESAFKTIFVSDEYEIMYKYFDIDGTKMQSLQYPCDKFDINPSKYFQASLIYFDTSEPFFIWKRK